MSGSGVELFGVSQLMARLDEMSKAYPKELDAALYQEALAIFRKSQRIVPVDKGFLKGSGVIEGPKNHEILIGYGGPAAPYALYVHEDPEAKHKSGKTYKFLEIPVMDAIAGMDVRIRDRLAQKQTAGNTNTPDTSDAPQSPETSK